MSNLDCVFCDGKGCEWCLVTYPKWNPTQASTGEPLTPAKLKKYMVQIRTMPAVEAARARLAAQRRQEREL